MVAINWALLLMIVINSSRWWSPSPGQTNQHCFSLLVSLIITCNAAYLHCSPQWGLWLLYGTGCASRFPLPQTVGGEIRTGKGREIVEKCKSHNIRDSRKENKSHLFTRFIQKRAKLTIFRRTERDHSRLQLTKLILFFTLLLWLHTHIGLIKLTVESRLWVELGGLVLW